MQDPVYEPRGRIEAIRGARGFDHPAPGLWRTGSLEGLARPTVAVVGTRAATPYGRRLAAAFAAQLGAAGCAVISGLALGIDAAAHAGALDAGAPTLGVLGGGHRHFFPRRNLGLAARMIEGGGGVLSPFPPGEPARRAYFLARNGIVAALADAVVVIEAPARSGAINTAGWAAGRIPVFAVPGDVDRPHGAGCLALIRDGAILARDAGDVLEGLGHARPGPFGDAEPPGDPLEVAILGALASGERDLDELVAATGAAASAALGALTLMELGGSVVRAGATRWSRAML